MVSILPAQHCSIPSKHRFTIPTMTETRRGARSRATQMTELPNGGVQVIFDSRPTNAKKGEYTLDICPIFELT